MITPIPPDRQEMIDIAKRHPSMKERFESQEAEFGGYTFADLYTAFTLVQDKENWKEPIVRALINKADARLIDAAISFFGGGGALFEQTVFPDLWYVSAPGYYLTIGS